MWHIRLAACSTLCQPEAVNQTTTSHEQFVEGALAAGNHLDVMHMMEHIACSKNRTQKSTVVATRQF